MSAPGRPLVALDTNVLLELLLARKVEDSSITSGPLQRGRTTQAEIRRKSIQALVVQQVLFECLHKLWESNLLTDQLKGGGYILQPRWTDLEQADRGAFDARWQGAEGDAARSLLDGIQSDPDVGVQLYPSDQSSTDWFDVQYVFYAAHRGHASDFQLSDLVIVSQVIAARCTRFITRDSKLRVAVDRLRKDADFRQTLRSRSADLAVPALGKQV